MLVFVFALAAASLQRGSAQPAGGSRYLFAWCMETTPAAKRFGRDFIAVFDIASDSKSFGRLVAMLPVGTQALMAHHTNYEMPANGMLFANDFMAGQSFVFDLRDPSQPHLVAQFGAAGPYTYPHSFATLDNGNVIATYQTKGSGDKVAGAVVELDDKGRVIRTSDASDPKADSFIRPYSLQVVPKLNRVVTSSSDMNLNVASSHVVQIWRLSDLKLIKSVVLPPGPRRWQKSVGTNSAEPRLLTDGVTVLVGTFTCGLYRINGLAGMNPTAQLVYDFGDRVCAIPVVAAHYWVEAIMSSHSVVSLDVSNPSQPFEVGHLAFGGNDIPHWVALEPSGNRIVVTGMGEMATRAYFATIDPQTGALTLDPRSISFARTWPDGWNGTAVPHGAVFSRN
jgi:hypothetical protein